jgi:hypothetical protein
MGGTTMVRAMSSWGIPTEVLAQRIAQVERKLGTDLLRRVLRAGKKDLWSVSIDLQRGRYVAIWTHYRAEKVIGRYSVVVERHGETLADGITACTCPDHQREVRRFGGWCKHELLTLFLLNPDLVDTAANFIKLICKVSEPEESESERIDKLACALEENTQSQPDALGLPEWHYFEDEELDLA